MKRAVIADTHFGVSGDSKMFMDNMELFFDKVFFPYLIKNKIKHVIHVGDVFHNRRKIDINTSLWARRVFFDRLAENGIHMDVIIGNHDTYKKQSSETNTPSVFFREMYPDNIDVYEDGAEVGPFLYIPWINNENRDKIESLINNTKKKIVFGHLELNGFNFSKVQIAKHGDDPNLFSKFEHVYSGHFHYKHNKGNITYLGSPTQQTWVDYGSERGFHVIDDETFDMEFIPNEYDIFRMVDYPSDDQIILENPQIVRINVHDIGKQSDLDKFLRDLENQGALKVNLVTPKSNDSTEKGYQGNIEVQDTLSFIRSNVENDSLYNVIENLYNEVQQS